MNTTHDFWQQLHQVLKAGEPCVLMVVTESSGSSPGRTGFKMLATRGGKMHGSIGGGSMEHKLVELARSLLDRPSAFPFLKRQVHRESETRDRSGMICSGEQTVAFFLLEPEQERLVRSIIDAADPGVRVTFGPSGVNVVSGSPGEVWYAERPGSRPRIAIVGGGHVGHALSRVMHQLGFLVLLFDHRDELNTMSANAWAHEKRVVDLKHIEDAIPDDPEIFIVLVSHGYRTDEVALRRLIRRPWRYLGMLGSKAKVEAMWTKLKAEGFADEELARVHAPIGLPINSRTPEEIAVSIAAEIVRVKNEG